MLKYRSKKASIVFRLLYFCTSKLLLAKSVYANSGQQPQQFLLNLC